jgi:beta-lactamase superfamily II metal-dependent hydrolase
VPRHAIISVGRHNMFGTDKNGAVTILTDGSSLISTSMLESRVLR